MHKGKKEREKRLENKEENQKNKINKEKMTTWNFFG